MGLEDRELKPNHNDSEASKLLKEILRSNTKILQEHAGGKKSGLKGGGDAERSESAPGTPALVGAAARCRQNPTVASDPGELAKLSREKLRKEAGAISGLDEERAPCADLETLRRAAVADERYICLGAGAEFWPLLRDSGQRIEAICNRLEDAEEELQILRRQKHLPDRTSKVRLVPRPEDNKRKEKKQVEAATAKFVDTLRFEIEEVDADGRKVKVDLLEQLERRMTGDVSFNQLRTNFERYAEHEPHPWLTALTDHALKDEAVFHRAMWGQTAQPSRQSAVRLPVAGRHVVLGGANESPLAQRRASGERPSQQRGSMHPAPTPLGRASTLRRDVSAPGRLSMLR